MEYLLNFLFALVVCLGLGQVLGMSDNFYFTQHPKFPDKVVEGQRLEVSCRVSEEDRIVYHWLLNNKLIENTTRRYQNTNTSSLVFARVHRSRDSGQYQCVAQNISSSYSAASSITELTVGWIGASIKVILLNPKDRSNIREGNSLTLQCMVEGSGFEVTWYRNSVRISPDIKVVVNETERTLTIEALSADHNGVYSCEVANNAGALVSQKNFPLTIARPDIANVRVLPQDLTVNRDSPAQFDCVYDNARRVEWFNRDPETPMKNATKGAHVIFPNGTLYFPKVRVKDVGSYRCVGVMHDGEVEEKPTLGYIAELKVVVRPEISRTTLFPVPSNNNKYIQRAGSTLEVFCRAKEGAYPSPLISWVNSKGKEVADGPFWLIEGVQPDDAGNYTCRAQNGFGPTEEYTVTLVVTILPVISQEPETGITVDEETTFQLFCAFKGSPGPLTTVTWMRSPPRSTQYQNIPATARHKVQNQGFTSQLLVQRAAADDDSGNYRCQVTTVGFDPVYSESAVVLIRERLKFTSKPLNQHLELASKAKIHCRAHATEAVRIRWTKKGEGKSVLPSHLRVDRNGTLWFDGVKKTDEGWYICMAETKTEVINATARVDVVVSPKFTVKPGDAVVFVGHTLVLDCQAVGDPTPAIYWDKEGQQNNSESRWQIASNGSLIIQGVRPFDGGHYGCTAGNKGGFKREEMELTVQPEAPSSVAQTVVITVSCASGYIILVVALVIYCKRKRSRKSEPETSPLTVLTPEHIIQTSYSAPESTVLLPKHPPSLASSAPHTQYERQSSSAGRRAYSNSSHLYETAHLPSATGSDDPRNSPNTSSAYSSAVNSNGKPSGYPSRKQLHNLQKIGHGHFGDVFTAGMIESSCTLVVVKMLQAREDDAVLEFTAEYDMYRKLNHPNVVQCLGMCPRTRATTEWAVYEHTKAGNLKSFLRANSENITHLHRISFLRQIAQGMQYIADHRHVHKDLAARNCVVDVLPNNELIVKVSNLALVRDNVHAKEYGIHQHCLLPIRWMPAEAIFEDEYSTKSDVWAFGVTCFEVLTLCTVLPYDEMDDQMVLRLLREARLQLLTGCDGYACEIYREEQELIERCMTVGPSDRPTFTEILNSWQLSSINDHA